MKKIQLAQGNLTRVLQANFITKLSNLNQIFNATLSSLKKSINIHKYSK